MTSLVKKPKLPEIKDPDPLPMADDKMGGMFRKLQLFKSSQRSGNQSTILSGGGRETLGA